VLLLRRNPATVLAALALALLAAVVLAVALGAVAVPPGDIARMALARLAPGRLAVTWTPGDEVIVFTLRLPRVVAAALVGGALAVAGVVFQGLLQNPLADPYIIGTSGGAALGATIALSLPVQALWFGFGLVPVLAFAGAMVAVLVVYNIARVGARAPVVTLLLTGFATSSMLAAVMSLLMLVSGATLRRIILWTMGGLAVTGWSQVAIVAPLVLGAMLVAGLFARDLNAFLLGEEEAAYLGVNVERRKLTLLLLGSLLTGAAVSLSGLVGFVGLVIPHVARLVLGPDHRLLLPASALVGAAFLVLADLLARSLLAPTEIPVGIVTALVGAPFFIYLLRRSKREYRF
jgi:iron complex transport system permease protein